MDALAYSVKECKYTYSQKHTRPFACPDSRVKEEISSYFESFNALLEPSSSFATPFINISNTELCLLVYNLGAFSPHISTKINASALNRLLAELEYALWLDPKILSQLLSGLLYLSGNIDGKLNSKAIDHILVMLGDCGIPSALVRSIYALLKLADANLLDMNQHQIDINPLLDSIANNAFSSHELFKALQDTASFVSKTNMSAKISADSLDIMISKFSHTNTDIFMIGGFLKNLASLASTNHIAAPISGQHISALLYTLVSRFSQSPMNRYEHDLFSNTLYFIGEISSSGMLSTPIAHDVMDLTFQALCSFELPSSNMNVSLAGISFLASSQRLSYPIDNSVVEHALKCAVSAQCIPSLKASILSYLGIFSESGYLMSPPCSYKINHLLCIIPRHYFSEQEICLIINSLSKLAISKHLPANIDSGIMPCLFTQLIEQATSCESIISALQGLLNIYRLDPLRSLVTSKQICALLNIFYKNNSCPHKESAFRAVFNELVAYRIVDDALLYMLKKNPASISHNTSPTNATIFCRPPLLLWSNGLANRLPNETNDMCFVRNSSSTTSFDRDPSSKQKSYFL